VVTEKAVLLETEAPARVNRAGGRLAKQTRRALKSAWRAWFFIAVIGAWWFLSRDSTSTFFPPLSDIVRRFYQLWIVGDAASTITSSLLHFVIGFALSGIGGIVIGVLLWKFPRTSTAVSPLLYFIYVLPAAAMLPAVAAVMGYGAQMKVTIIVLAAIWPTLLNTLDGMRSIDPVRLDTAKVLHMSGFRTIRSVVFPNAMPQIMAGLRNSLQVAVIMMVVSELIASTSGIGFFILNAQQSFAITDMWTGIIALGLIGSALTLVFIAIEHFVLRWYLESRVIERNG
jgi:sulfonate transport system permease protein